MQKWLESVSRENTSTEENEIFEGESLQGWTVQNSHTIQQRLGDVWGKRRAKSVVSRLLE